MEYFTIGQISKKLRVSVSTIKRWSRELLDIKRNKNGWMLFNEADIKLLKKKKNHKPYFSIEHCMFTND